MPPLMIDPHTEEGSGAVRVLVMRTLSRQIGQERHAFRPRCHYLGAPIEIIPTGTQRPVNPVECEASVLYCRHPIPVDSISSTVEVGASGWIGERFWAELHQLRSGPQRQLDGTRHKQASPQDCRSGIGSTHSPGPTRFGAERD